jgi:hypothetical protein
VGRSIGREADADPLGYGSNIIIRFQDKEGRYYIVHESDDQGLRVVIDRRMTKWDSSENEIRSMIIFDYNDGSVEDAVRTVAAIAPGFDGYVRESRLVYVRKAYSLPSRKSYIIEISFQNADGNERYLYTAPDPYSQPLDILRRNTLDYRILETMTVINPPKDKKVVRAYFGERKTNEAKPGAKADGKTGPKQPSAGAGTVAKKPGVSKKGSIQPPEEGVEVLKALSADGPTVEYIVSQHEKAVGDYNAGKYAMALRVFGRIAEMADGNYLDSYWAALSAHGAKKPEDVKKWLDRCLGIKSDYLPALEMKKALKLK